MTSPNLDSFKSLDGLPSLPGHIMSFLDEIDGISAMDYNILQKIQYDPAIALKVLKIANAPLYGYASKIDSLQQAAALLGPGAIKNVVLMTPILQRYQEKEQVALSVDYPNLWLHMAVTAAISSGLGNCIEGMVADVCFTAGLIQGSGKIALATLHPESLVKVLEIAANQNISLREAEREVLGFTDADVSATLAREWRFPDILVTALENCSNTREEGIADKLPALLCLARGLAEQWGYPDTLTTEEREGKDELFAALNVTAADLEGWTPKLREYAELAARSQGL